MNTYRRRGVSPKKEDVHKALVRAKRSGSALRVKPSGSSFKSKVQPLKDAFSPALKGAFHDIHALGKDPLFLMHSDGSGSKSNLAYLMWKETGTYNFFRGISEDALVMNSDDLMCAGLHQRMYFCSSIARNKRRIPYKVLAALFEGNEIFCEKLRSFGIEARLLGGETADLGEIVQTLVVDASACGWMKQEDLISTKNIKPGSLIVGLASFGKASYEEKYNSGISANGLSSARHDLLQKKYLKKYPETVDSSSESSLLYSGDYSLQDALKSTSLSIGEALLSPTRTFLPVFKEIIKNIDTKKIQAMFNLTGGGQTKCLHFGNKIHYVKNSLFPFPPIFQLLAEKTPLKEMFQVYNCGHRLEFIVSSPKVADIIIEISKSFNIAAQIVGYTEPLKPANLPRSDKKNSLTIHFQNSAEKIGKKYKYSL